MKDFLKLFKRYDLLFLFKEYFLIRLKCPNIYISDGKKIKYDYLNDYNISSSVRINRYSTIFYVNLRKNIINSKLVIGEKNILEKDIYLRI